MHLPRICSQPEVVADVISGSQDDDITITTRQNMRNILKFVALTAFAHTSFSKSALETLSTVFA